ncbi:hypothetical protein ALC57_04401 [Trachymyrmex cornetzi]|uniref:Uncharacterized protein n=1 Tax=Trachymyrmex cornetzi TaxID=471704 RepID=A0A151JCA9_9HYME|nr:hypothetical protein ALC57_04401 [Trachymyrmex cornetzi]
MIDILNITGEPIFDDRIVKIEIGKLANFFASIVAVRPPKKDDNNAQALIELIQSNNLTDDTKIVLQLRLLLHLLPPRTRIRSKKTQWKPSIPECKDSIIISTTVSIMIINIRQYKIILTSLLHRTERKRATSLKVSRYKLEI